MWLCSRELFKLKPSYQPATEKRENTQVSDEQGFRGGVAQSGRAIGSYPVCHRFKSYPRYHEPLTKISIEIFVRVHGTAIPLKYHAH